MTSRHIFEAVDRTLIDIFGVADPKFERIPFGDRLFVFGGDFRQTLPVIPNGSRSDIIGQCTNRSILWQYVVTIRLQTNMRVQQALTDNNLNMAQDLSRFSEYLLSVGNGSVDELEYTIRNGTHINTDHICIANDMIIRGDNLITLLRNIYPRLYQSIPGIDDTALINSTVLTPTNKEVQIINDLELDTFPGESSTYLSADLACDQDLQVSVLVEYLNFIVSGILPLHKLILKVGTPVMLLRNLNALKGLCNGTRLIVRSLLPNIIEVTITAGSNIGDIVYIPKIKIIITEGPHIPVAFSRKQSPVGLAFAMTVNKPQGQAMKWIGLYLPQNVFSHG